jgi:superfamily II DNA or RNA helicase
LGFLKKLDTRTLTVATGRAMVRVSWKGDSKFLSRSEPQEEAVAVLDHAMKDERHGIVILPCGSGKSALIVETALRSGTKCLILCFEKQGVVQMATLLRDHTTLVHNQVCMLTGESKDEPNSLVCFVVMTYGLYASSVGATKKGRASAIGDFLKSQVWDCVACDEIHHANAATYRPCVEALKGCTKHLFGFTGTLFRGDDAVAGETREEHEERVFGWFGSVIFRRTCQDLEERGLIAKVRRRKIMTPFTHEHNLAHQMTTGAMRVNVHSVHPTKLNATVQICAIHKALRHSGMIFVTHLYAAKVLKRMLGERWEILAGSSSHGDEGKHTALHNASLVAKFNEGALDGLISTSVGESALDVFNETFRFLIVLDAHGGEASAAQRVGRLFRTPRITRKPGQTNAALLNDRIASQKHGFYFDLVTPGTEEETAAKAREAKFVSEGYAASDEIPFELLMRMNNTVCTQVKMPYKNLRDCLFLLKETLQYQELGRNAALGKVAAAEVRAPHLERLAAARVKAKRASVIFKQRHEATAQKIAKQRPSVKEEARKANREVLESTELPPESVAVFRALNLSKVLLAELQVDLGVCFGSPKP